MDFVLQDLLLGQGFTCVLSTEGGVKCFGRNSKGQLGYGHTDDIGDEANEMGDYLDYVDLGTDFVASHFAATGGVVNHVCVVSTENEVKCWGDNEDGQLGVGDTTNRGDVSGTMGDALPIVDLQISTAAPTPAECPSAAMYGVNWDEFVCCPFIASSSLNPLHFHSVSTALSMSS